MTLSTIALRADASASIGRGHIARCSAVARSLRGRGTEVVVVSYDLPPELAAALLEVGCAVVDLDDPEDPQEVIRALEGDGGLAGAPTLVVDHYGLDTDWQAAVRPSVGRLIAIEDRPVRAHDVDVLVDANGGADRAYRYLPLVGEATQIVTGQDHALIDPAYAQRQQESEPRHGSVRRVLVQLGSDRSGLVERVVSALQAIGVPGLQVDVVLPDGHGSLPTVREQVSSAGWRVHTDVTDIHELYARVDLAVAAPGVSVWERCAMGVPSVVIETTPRHAGAYADLARSPAVTNLGQATELDTAVLVAALDRELRRGDLRERSLACRSLVDGRGASRMASLLSTRADHPTSVREQHLGDEARLLRWANDPATRAWSFSSAPIDPEAHRRWFRGRLADPARFRQYVLEDAWGTELGSLRFERRTSAWQMSAVLSPGFRGRGFASVLIAQGCDRLAGDLCMDVEVTAQVRTVSPGAGRALTRLGFAQVHRDEQAGSVTYRRRWPRPPGSGSVQPVAGD